MPEFSPAHLARWTGGRWTAEPSGAGSGFCIDSRQLRSGQVFVAIKTGKRDGHDFLRPAAAAGAAAAIVALADPEIALPQLVVGDPLAAFQAIAREHRRAFRGRVVGISGSAGKTSTKELLALLLGGAVGGVPATGDSLSPAAADRPFTGRVLATEGNLNNHLGVPLTLTRLDPALHDFAVVEAGISAPGEMRLLADMIEPDLTLITLIAAAHTEELHGLEGVAAEKAKLAAATRPAGLALFSRETARFAPFRELGVPRLIVERVAALGAGAPPSGTVPFTLAQRADQTSIVVAGGAPRPLAFALRRVSDGMAQNAVLAVCAALRLGIPPDLVQERLAAWQPAALRGELRREPGRLLYLDCYNANPAAMADALDAFEAIAPAAEPRLFVIGSMEELGGESSRHHQEVGRRLKLRPGDQAYLIGEGAAAMWSGASECPGTAGQVRMVRSAEEIADVVRGWRGAIFVKGSRRYQLEKVLAGPTSPDLAH